MLDYKLGTIEASEALLRDLYIDLRHKVNAWSEITQQTPQARMGYIGQHLVSVVTGYPGGKSGARGYDLIMGHNKVGEIKSCYRVDQLGKCKDCGSPVSGYETTCASCSSDEIERKDDSKWLIPVKDDTALCKVISPEQYYFVLFEYSDMSDIINSEIVVSIWEVDPKTKGFAYCMMDYHVNSAKNAPFNMWPYMIKFALTNPKLIYRSYISPSGDIQTDVFPTKLNGYYDEIEPLTEYYSSKTITVDIIKRVIKRIDQSEKVSGLSKMKLLEKLETLRRTKDIENLQLCDYLAEEIYLPLIRNKKNKIPKTISDLFEDLR